ncbi:MAG: undecaprenyl-diphosphate phosphatase [Alphaproteobacteria bacterium]|nr:undecaprenyl-diphosphate phosphatase [Rhodospirillales bacterium]MCW9045757.1 undecaprenyl-diphosphate phosphatase [Alphaproteobacteria bacterium]
MELLHLAVLAIIQGITEFLPISSSGHLALVPIFTGWKDQGLLMDVAVHVGTLGAVMVYFWRDIFDMLYGLGQMLKGKSHKGAKLFGLVFFSTLPVIGAGYYINEFYDIDSLRTLEVIGWTTLGFGVLLYFSDKFGMTINRVEHMTWGTAIMIGLAQCLALIPGTSRSGITMTMARILGFERSDAARFSMLMSIPTILGAGALKGLELYKSGNHQLTSDAFMGAGLSFAVALVSIALLMAWLRRATFTPFVIYRLLLGSALLALAYA